MAEKNLSPVPEDLLREAQQAAEEQRAMPGVQVRSQQMTLRGDGDAMLSAATVVQSLTRPCAVCAFMLAMVHIM